jgi:hypothetical protein
MPKTVDILTNLSFMLSVIYYILSVAYFSAPFAAYLLSIYLPCHHKDVVSGLEKIVQAST